MRLAVRVTPRGGRDGIDGWAQDPAGRPYLRVRVCAAAADGAANAALIALLSKALGRPKGDVSIISGETARLKRLEIVGLDEAGLSLAFGPPP
jgi:uncharacterized protein YggU (UPF0235/DUF167 family)